MDILDFDDDLTDQHLAESGVDIKSTEEALSLLLHALGEKPEREGLKNTPKRVARMYTELLSGYHADPQKIVNGALFNITYDEMVIVRDIEFYSLCEHHLLPFLGHAHIAYMPAGKVIGLSKIPRIVDVFAHRLQVQERLTRQIADQLQELLKPNGVAVVMEGMHLCSMMRGVKKTGARLITSSMQGSFRTNPATRQEFLDNIGRGSMPLKI